MQLVCRFVVKCLMLNIHFKALHVPGFDNSIADALSRFQMVCFRQPAFGVDPVMTPLPVDLWNNFFGCVTYSFSVSKCLAVIPMVVVRHDLHNTSLPPSLVQIIDFIAFLSVSGYAPLTVAAYVSGIAATLHLHCLPDVTNHFIVRRLLEGCCHHNARQDSVTLLLLTFYTVLYQL